METKTVKRQTDETPSKSSGVFKKILVALDGSESAERAAGVALELAAKLKANLIVLHAISPPSSYYHSSIMTGPMVSVTWLPRQTFQKPSRPPSR